MKLKKGVIKLEMINENTIHEESSSSFPKGLEEFRQNIKNKDNIILNNIASLMIVSSFILFVCIITYRCFLSILK